MIVSTFNKREQLLLARICTKGMVSQCFGQCQGFRVVALGDIQQKAKFDGSMTNIELLSQTDLAWDTKLSRYSF